MIEYILLLTTVVAIVLVGFKKYLPSARDSSNIYFNQVGIGILGAPNRCGDGVLGEFETNYNCCEDGGGC